jgi:hypothetical protein
MSSKSNNRVDQMPVSNKIVSRVNLMTCQAFKPVPELALEKVDDQTVVATPIQFPFLITCNLWRQSLQLGLSLGR